MATIKHACVCENCNENIDVSNYRFSHSKTGIFFCSHKCANLHRPPMSEEVKEKIRLKAILNNAADRLNTRESRLKRSLTILQRYGGGGALGLGQQANTPESLERRRLTLRAKNDKKKFEDKSKGRRRAIILEEVNYKCEWCAVSKWRNQPLTLEIDHIDGNNKNNRRENLRALCPNCHSQTLTFRNRKRILDAPVMETASLVSSNLTDCGCNSHPEYQF